MFLLENQKQKVIEQLTTCDPKYINQHINILVKSDFLVDSFYHHPDWLIEISNNQPNEFEYQNYQKWLNIELESISNEERLMTVLRQFRRKILTRINWSQIVNSCSTENTLKQLSTLAEVLIISARDFLYKLSCQDWGTPCNTQGVAQPLLILGMGKLGGFELNFSSDIDLIFTYPENGTTKGGRRELDNSIFFTRLGQRLIKALNQVTQDGFVYRVDMRLRPLGDGGPLVLSFTSFEDYYQEQGRDWERYAMVKAKILGDQNDPFTKELYQILKPFVYRRYIDFSVLQSLRNMKGMIEREVRRRGLHDNIKLGAGGIREIEFIVQVFQLIRGGRIHSLQTRSLLKALTVIESEHMLNQQEMMLLRDNYLFLRRCENLLQGINDEQTQTLPNDELNQLRLALGMGFENWSQFYQTLMQRMLETRNIFNQLIGYDESEEAIPHSKQNNDGSYDDLWLSDLSYEEVKQILPNLSDSSSLSLFEQISQFRKDISKRTIGLRGREILDRLMPKIFALSCESESAISTMPRVLKLLVNIVSRTTYLELLLEYPNALKQLIHLCDSSIMISEQLARHPLLLDELINFNSLYKMIEIDQYQSELYQYLLRIDPNDEEQQIEALRQFKQMQLLRISASDIMGILPTMKVSDHLTYLAEAMLEFVLQMSWNQMVNRYGKPDHLNGNDKGIISIGYGKLGGLELGYASDLDLVFLHDCPENGMTTGNKVIDSRQFYLRLVQRIIHLFSVRTNSGILYEIDLRLRPQGNSGLLACSLHSFEEYQMNEAWTWEHQALVRTRVVAGDFTLQSRFLQIRNQILMQKREQDELKKEIREMRQKMRTHLSNHDRDKFDIKIDEGGIGDIEFISQYLVLNYANSHPKIAIWSDNVRIFEMAARLGILPNDDAETLIKIYIAMRNEMHRLSLQNSSNKVSSEIFKEERKLILQIWLKLLS